MKKLLTYISAVTTLVMLLSYFACFAVSADKQEINTITLLGDSITYGYGLEENQHNYGWYLGEYYGAEVENLAQNGLTSEELIDMLETDDVQQAVKNADMVCLSIGGNDLLHIFTESLMGIMLNGGNSGILGNLQTNSGAAVDPAAIGIDEDFISNTAKTFIDNFKKEAPAKLKPAAEQAMKNVKAISEKLKELNPTGEIVMQTVYAPFDSSDEKLAEAMEQLNEFAAEYIDSMINEAIRANECDIADIYLKFSEKPRIYTNIDKMDIHPNYIGHMLIAEEIVETVGLEGDFTPFKEFIDTMPYGSVSEMPEYITNELDEISKGSLRRGTLESLIKREASIESTQTETVTEATDEKVTEAATTTQAAQHETEAATEKKEEKSGLKNTLARICMVLGLALILAVTTFKFIRGRKKRK